MFHIFSSEKGAETKPLPPSNEPACMTTQSNQSPQSFRLNSIDSRGPQEPVPAGYLSQKSGDNRCVSNLPLKLTTLTHPADRIFFLTRSGQKMDKKIHYISKATFEVDCNTYDKMLNFCQ
jgi:hypothetical protein